MPCEWIARRSAPWGGMSRKTLDVDAYGPGNRWRAEPNRGGPEPAPRRAEPKFLTVYPKVLVRKSQPSYHGEGQNHLQL
eukprot:8676765-Pyramimonas_sp.AAC.1